VIPSSSNGPPQTPAVSGQLTGGASIPPRAPLLLAASVFFRNGSEFVTGFFVVFPYLPVLPRGRHPKSAIGCVRGVQCNAPQNTPSCGRRNSLGWGGTFLYITRSVDILSAGAPGEKAPFIRGSCVRLPDIFFLLFTRAERSRSRNPGRKNRQSGATGLRISLGG